MTPEKKVVMDTTWTIGRQAANFIFYESATPSNHHAYMLKLSQMVS